MVLEPGSVIIDVAPDTLKVGYARIAVNITFNFALVCSVHDVARVYGSALLSFAKENPRGAGAVPPIVEAVDCPGACTKG